MNLKKLSKAMLIKNNIERHKNAIEFLEDVLNGKDLIIYNKGFDSGLLYFEDWEIRLMIHQKKQRIAALEKQLEEL